MDPTRRQPSQIHFVLSLVLLLSQASQLICCAQSSTAQSELSESENPRSTFRLERVPVEGGAELLTILADLKGLGIAANGQRWVPMVTVLRDTLGDGNAENDRLRYLWAMTYTRPSLKQRVLAAVPFLYTRVGNKDQSHGTPPPVIDLSTADRDVWERIFWTALQNILFDPYGIPVKAATRSYRRNISDYRKSHIVRALSVLSLYQAVVGSSAGAFTDSELREMQGRLLLTDKSFGGIVDDINLEPYFEKQTTQVRDVRGHNWEMLRQRAEAESLFFQPLQLPDGSATHAMVWVARTDLETRRGQPFDGRFLNIANPWTDKRLQNWQGYVETFHFDAEHNPVPPGTPASSAVEMIPLALYGLDNPKIPLVLVDFRDGLNPKRRELSRRMLQDVTQNILSLSSFGDLPYFLGRTIFDFVTGRRGIDVNQPSRLRTYAQLKLLLSLSDSLQPPLRDEISKRVEKVSSNPLENDLEAEMNLAQQQYKALLAYAGRADGLPARLQRDRRSEMVSLEHGRTEQILFRLASILSFGKYSHREKATSDMVARLDIKRRLAYNTRFLFEVARSSPQTEVAWQLDEIRTSIQFIAENGPEAGSKAATAVAQIFAKSKDNEIRRTCLYSLSRINNDKARWELLRISQNRDLEQTWRDLGFAYLDRKPNSEDKIAGSGDTPIGHRQ